MQLKVEFQTERYLPKSQTWAKASTSFKNCVSPSFPSLNKLFREAAWWRISTYIMIQYLEIHWQEGKPVREYIQRQLPFSLDTPNRDFPCVLSV